jgi:uncharacterized membrane protein (DUF2068 family)
VTRGASSTRAPQPALARDGGLRLIIFYKVVKGTLSLALAVVLVGMLLTNRTGPFEAIGVHLRRHVAGAWSVALARFLMSAAQPHHLRLIAAALTFDGLLSLLEGWALHHRHWWGPWLVVVATSSLLPFEVVSLARRVHVGRLVILALNVAIVIYLARRARREHAERLRAEAGTAAPGP